MRSGGSPREVLVKAYFGAAIEAKTGELVTVTDLEGKQIGDFVAFNLDDRTEWLDMARTRSTLYRLHLKLGDRLYSQRLSTRSLTCPPGSPARAS